MKTAKLPTCQTGREHFIVQKQKFTASEQAYLIADKQNPDVKAQLVLKDSKMVFVGHCLLFSEDKLLNLREVLKGPQIPVKGEKFWLVDPKSVSRPTTSSFLTAKQLVQEGFAS